MFPIQVVFGVGLVLGTIYLRHHWAADILAGFALTLVAFWCGPPLERWWERAAARFEARRAGEIVRGGSHSGTPSPPNTSRRISAARSTNCFATSGDTCLRP